MLVVAEKLKSLVDAEWNKIVASELMKSSDCRVDKSLEAECTTVRTNAINARFLNLIKVKIVHSRVIQTHSEDEQSEEVIKQQFAPISIAIQLKFID